MRIRRPVALVLATLALIGWALFAFLESRRLRELGQQRAAAAPDSGGITHGPILGRLGAHEVGVWARTSRTGFFRVRYRIDPERMEALSPPARTQLATDNTGVVMLRELEADAVYHYRVFTEGGDGPGGTFRTLPDADDVRHDKFNPRGLFNFRFEVSSCANQGVHSNGPALPAYQTMLKHLKDQVHFAIHNGDFIYEEKREFSPQEWLGQVRASEDQLPRIVRLAPAITGVWENYKLYLSRGKPLAEWHRNVPGFFTFDDHEILNDVVGCGTPGYRHRRTVFRDPAVRAWFDYVGWANPVESRQPIRFGRAKLEAGSDVLTALDGVNALGDPDLAQAANLHVHWGTRDAGVNDDALDVQPGDPNAGVYEIVEKVGDNQLRIRPAAKANGEATYSIGRLSQGKHRIGNCEFYFLDTRSMREKHDGKDPAKPGISMLGQKQKSWLIDSMKQSDADFFFVISSVNLTIPHTGAGGMAAAAADKDDAWTAFVDEREQLIKVWESLGRPVFVFTGDLHNSFAIRVSEKVWEFGAGPLNSANHPASSEGGRPASGPFDSRGRKVDIRWSTYCMDDIPLDRRRQPVYCV